jgi:hypothetical protein
VVLRCVQARLPGIVPLREGFAIAATAGLEDGPCVGVAGVMKRFAEGGASTTASGQPSGLQPDVAHLCQVPLIPREK